MFSPAHISLGMMTRSDSNDLIDSPVHAFPELDLSRKRNDDEEDDALAVVDGSMEGEVVAGSPRPEPVVADDAVTLPPRDVSGRTTPQATELSGVSERDDDADGESRSSEEASEDAVQDGKPVSPASVVAASVPTYRLDESMEEIHLHDASGAHVVPTLIGEPLTENGGLGYIPVAEATVVSPSHIVQASVISVPPTPASPKFDEVSLFISARCGEFTQILSRLRDDDSKWKMVLSARDADGHSVLHWAALFDAADFISAACSRADKSFVDARSTNGQTPLMWCCIKGNLKSLKLLYHRFHADLTAVDTLKADCGVLAVQHHQHNVLLLLYKWRKDEAGRHPFEWADVSGCTAAHWAAYKGDTLMLRILLYVKTDLDVVDAQGMTPLHRAVSEGWNETAAFLVDTAGCNKHAKNAKGESPVDIAKRLENWALMYTLRETDACGDDKCKKSHAKKNAHDGPMGSGRWGLPAIFTACLSCLIITFFADLYSTASGVLSTGFISCVLIVMYLYTGLLTGDPGAVPKRLPGNSAIEELQDKLDDVNTTIAPGEGVNKICFTCWENKDVNLRIKHCAVCNSCFEGFDHHCMSIPNPFFLSTCICRRVDK